MLVVISVLDQPVIVGLVAGEEQCSRHYRKMVKQPRSKENPFTGMALWVRRELALGQLPNSLDLVIQLQIVFYFFEYSYACIENPEINGLRGPRHGYGHCLALRVIDDVIEHFGESVGADAHYIFWYAF